MRIYKTIRAELDAFPDTYSALSDADAAAAMNQSKAPSAYRPITANELVAWSAMGADTANVDTIPAAARAWPRILRIEAASKAAPPYDGLAKAYVGIAWSAFELVKKESTTLDFNRADRLQLLGVLVAAGILSPAEQTELLALGKSDGNGNALTTTRGQEIGVGHVRTGYVTKARAL